MQRHLAWRVSPWCLMLHHGVLMVTSSDASPQNAGNSKKRKANKRPLINLPDCCWCEIVTKWHSEDLSHSIPSSCASILMKDSLFKLVWKVQHGSNRRKSEGWCRSQSGYWPTADCFMCRISAWHCFTHISWHFHSSATKMSFWKTMTHHANPMSDCPVFVCFLGQPWNTLISGFVLFFCR